MLGNTHTELGDPTTAERWLWLAIARRPMAETYNSLAKSLILRDCVDEAMVAWERALALDPRHQSSLFNYAQCLYHLKKNDYPLAERYLAVLVEIDPDDAQARLLLGSCLVVRKEFEQAREHFTRCTELRPGYWANWEQLAEVERLSGSISRARAALALGLACVPDDPRLLRSLEELAGGE